MTDRDTPEQIIASVGRVRQLVNGRELVLLANGYPVNFVGESVPDQEIAFILALLQQCAIRLAQQAGELPAGILEVPGELQKEIESHHDGFLR